MTRPPPPTTCRVTVLVGPDCLGPALRALLDDACGRLEVAVHEIGPSYAGLLVAAARRGVRTRLLVDDHPGPTSGALALLRRERAGVQVRTAGGRRGTMAHWKMVVAGSAEGDVLAVGTGNLDLRDAPWRPPWAGTREVWVVVGGHPRMAAAARAAVDATWAAARPVPVVAPAVPIRIPPVRDPGTGRRALTVEIPKARLGLRTGGAAVAGLLAERIAACRRRALVCVPYVHPGVAAPRALLAALAAAADRGADVRLLLGADPARDRSAATPAALRRLGVCGRVMDPARVTTGHAKLAVLDGTLICSSANWSGAGLGGNLEAALAVDDGRAADHVAAVIAHDWEASTAAG